MHADENERLIPKQSKSYYVLVVAIIAAVLLAGALAWYFYQRDDGDSEMLLDPSDFDAESEAGTVQRDGEKEKVAPPPPLTSEQASEYEFPETVPDLEDSDIELQTQLAQLAESDDLTTWLQTDDMARKGTAVAFALADGEVAYEYLSLPAPKGKFKAKSKDKKTYIDTENFQRYEPIVKAIDSVDVDYAVAFYRHYWPLFSNAFAELGEPDNSLQSAVMSGIDLLLETPDVEGDIELTRPSVYWKFADKDLEKLKPAQKLLLRMGPENRAVIKAKLQTLKEQLEFAAAENAEAGDDLEDPPTDSTSADQTADDEPAPEESSVKE